MGTGVGGHLKILPTLPFSLTQLPQRLVNFSFLKILCIFLMTFQVRIKLFFVFVLCVCVCVCVCVCGVAILTLNLFISSLANLFSL